LSVLTVNNIFLDKVLVEAVKFVESILSELCAEFVGTTCLSSGIDVFHGDFTVG